MFGHVKQSKFENLDKLGDLVKNSESYNHSIRDVCVAALKLTEEDRLIGNRLTELVETHGSDRSFIFTSLDNLDETWFKVMIRAAGNSNQPINKISISSQDWNQAYLLYFKQLLEWNNNVADLYLNFKGLDDTSFLQLVSYLSQNTSVKSASIVVSNTSLITINQALDLLKNKNKVSLQNDDKIILTFSNTPPVQNDFWSKYKITVQN